MVWGGPAGAERRFRTRPAEDAPEPAARLRERSCRDPRITMQRKSRGPGWSGTLRGCAVLPCPLPVRSSVPAAAAAVRAATVGVVFLDSVNY